MENQLWSLFRETGEPMGYLLYRKSERLGAPGRGKDAAQDAKRRGAGAGDYPRAPAPGA